MKAVIITIGDEILLGQMIDTNSVWLSQQLTSLGIDVVHNMSIPDKDDSIKSVIDIALKQADLLFFTGGLGPTKDDITKKSLAEYFDLEMVFDQLLYDKISSYFKTRGIPITEMHRQQCYMPSGIRILDNNMGTAPGMLFEKNNKWVISMPGVPYEMKHIFSESLFPLLRSHYPEYGKIYFRTIRTAGVGETRIAELIADISCTLPPEISLAFLPSLGHVKLRLTSKSGNDFKDVLDLYTEKIADRLGKLVYGFNDISLEKALKRDFVVKGLSLSAAESCTGGYLTHRITSVPGVSEYFLGSLVSYANSLKENILGVSPETIERFGAVSEETVLAMLNGILDLTGSDLGVSISGIAGPGGGTKEKPVGTVWMAWGNKNKQKTKKLQLTKDRLKNIEYTSVAAMNSLRLFLTEL